MIRQTANEFSSLCCTVTPNIANSCYALSYHNIISSCYNKCLKSFFGYHRRFSLTQALLQTGLPSFDTVLHNGACIFNCMWHNSQNLLVQYLDIVD